jgi:hypothetical protein
MALRIDFKRTMGWVTIRNNGYVIRLDIHVCLNAICAFIYKIGERRDLCGFFTDKKNISNMIRHGCRFFIGEVVNVKLNLWYPESKDVLKYFTRMGYQVKCYYKEPDKTK